MRVRQDGPKWLRITFDERDNGFVIDRKIAVGKDTLYISPSLLRQLGRKADKLQEVVDENQT